MQSISQINDIRKGCAPRKKPVHLDGCNLYGSMVLLGLYPDDKYDNGYFGVFDYSIDIDGEPCNQVLVIKTGKERTPIEIGWES